ncbi:hypothetical protein CU098_001763, partial [Rhizopus stolonifer]
MKSVRFYLNNTSFDSQYTFELQGYISPQDFQFIMGTLNATVLDALPPGDKIIWSITLCVLWLLGIMTHCLSWHYTHRNSLPFLSCFMIFTTLLFIWRYRSLRKRFEIAMLNTCHQINATENIRGIHVRLSQQNPNKMLSTVYSIVIGFDDRYNTLSSQQFNRYSSVDFVTVPLNVHR